MDDYISRSEAENELRNNLSQPGDAIESIRSIPSANVRPVVRGEWELIKRSFEFDGVTVCENLPSGYRCTICGRIERKKEPFCNCGAMMK